MLNINGTLLINSNSLSFDILSCSSHAKFLTLGCVSKRPVPIVFVFRSTGLICFSDPDFEKSWCFSKRNRISLNFKNDNIESLLSLKTTIQNLKSLLY